MTGGDAPFDRGRIRSRVEHHLVVIRLEHEQIALRERETDLCGRPTQIGRDSGPESGALVDDRNSDWIRGVVDGYERLDAYVAH